MFWRPDATTDQWQLVEADWEDTEICGIARNGRDFLVVTRAGERTNGLYALDGSTGKLGQCLFRDPTGSMADVSLRFAPSGNIAGVHYHRQMPVFHWFDPNFKALQALVDQRLPDTINEIRDWSDDLAVVLIHSWKIGDPGQLMLLDLKQRKLRKFTTVNPQLDRTLLSPTRLATFASRDGTNVQTVLLVPKSASPENPCPVVVYFGLTPWSRIGTHYFSAAQWLAANGIAVLCVNDNLSLPDDAAGPEPRRYDLRSAAQRRNEAVQAAIQTGLVDAKRVGFIAFNSSGIMALESVAGAPETYRCGVFVDGVFSPQQYMDYLKTRAIFDALPEFERTLARTPNAKTDFFAAEAKLPATLKTKFLFSRDDSDTNVFTAGETTREAYTRFAAEATSRLKKSGANCQTTIFVYDSSRTELAAQISRWKTLLPFLKENL